MVIPYFTPSGTTFFDLSTPGTITGLRLDTSRGEILKGLMEAVAMEMRLNLSILTKSGIPVTSLTAVGGGAKSPDLVQLKADVLGIPMRTLEIPEAGCRGTALSGASFKLGVPAESLARQWAREREVIDPRPDHARCYDEKFEQYRQFYRVMRDFHR